MSDSARAVLRPRANPSATVLVSRSPEETHAIGAELGRNLKIPDVVLLRGALGTGKTTLARGIAIGLGLADGSLVNSPSFTLVNIYEGKCPIYHVDLYRVEGDRELYSIGLDEFLGERGVTIVEWSERLGDPAGGELVIELVDLGGETREIRVARVRSATAGRKR